MSSTIQSLFCFILFARIVMAYTLEVPLQNNVAQEEIKLKYSQVVINILEEAVL